MLGQEPDGSTWRDYIGFVDGRLGYVTVPTSLTMRYNSGLQERRKVINRVINFVDAQQQSIPPELGHLTYDGGWEFLWADTLRRSVRRCSRAWQCVFPSRLLCCFTRRRIF